MSKDKFPVVAAAIVTNQGDILLGKKEEKDNHPISGQWHFPGGHLDEGEEIEEALKREIKEETGLEIEVHQIIDTYYGEEADLVRVLYHCESSSRDTEPRDDLEQTKWVSPVDLEEETGKLESEDIEERERIRNFLEKLEKMPAF